ncbi:hypothetical protein SARC_11124 [Sphaeroforma arctica JP610]|uniref:Uncharacterized protein n=1 Tax=Sphaeroforma arctica JP610 TaxID=667725 RepID=A0A0L0FHV9_9EUKA|nr:hypothetical protein SARC_11124 [Sphaeroforma arctica JP610]KNC76374.1 hypothetical protein SARC_11124 [Sphaeroforma arctica JP610]|eukprot:XP_014150276.1 hypothetical protein SARC_11124 [Sphaeroforma arctica JP610]
MKVISAFSMVRFTYITATSVTVTECAVKSLHSKISSPCHTLIGVALNSFNSVEGIQSSLRETNIPDYSDTFCTDDEINKCYCGTLLPIRTNNTQELEVNGIVCPKHAARDDSSSNNTTNFLYSKLLDKNNIDACSIPYAAFAKPDVPNSSTPAYDPLSEATTRKGEVNTIKIANGEIFFDGGVLDSDDEDIDDADEWAVEPPSTTQLLVAEVILAAILVFVSLEPSRFR